MSSNRCEDMVTAYIEWLMERIKVENIDGVCEITTPFLDRHNDHLQIYVRRRNNTLILTDDGYILRDLELSGFDITTPKRKQILDTILNGFGVRLQDDELIIESKYENFPNKKHALVQAMLAINDLFVMAAPVVATVFKEDVEEYLRLHGIRYTPSVKFTGKSGFDQSFDFVIPASIGKAERIVRAINRPTRQNVTLLIFAWTDIKEVRPIKSTAYSILNDSEQTINPDIISALQQYDITPIPWSKREEYVAELAD